MGKLHDRLIDGKIAADRQRARNLMHDLERIGVRLTRRADGAIEACPAGRLTDTHRDRIRALKGPLITHLLMRDLSAA